MDEWLLRIRHFYTPREWRAAGVLAVSYLIVFGLSAWILPDGARYNPASALALAALYFSGVRLWPVVYVVSLVAHVATGSLLLGIIWLPIFEVLQTTAGSWLLQKTNVDPLFRRYRDTFYFLVTAVIISTITPTLGLLIRAWRHLPDLGTTWWHSYIAMLFCFLIMMPFLLRWFIKPRFRRTPAEIAEILAVFSLLLFLDILVFLKQIHVLFGIPLVYTMMVPLFWIALKLRPRFMTLALLLTSVCAVVSIALYTDPSMVVEYLFQTEILLIALAIIFFIITSLEEDRRVNTNIMHSQMAALRNAVARESSESQAKNDFIAILSHELRNPLAPVLSSIDLLKLKGPRDEEDAELLRIMEDRMETVRRLLDDLLDISRISEGKIALKKETVELEVVIKRAVLSTEHHRKELHQRLVLSLPKKIMHVLGDAVRLEQVFSNLLTNASKYSASGATVSLSLREDGSFADIEVADRGIGLKPQELETIFLPFHQLSPDDKRKGLGIGLTLVRNFVQMHGGTIEAASEGVGRGSRFTVRVPLVTSDIPQTPHKTKTTFVGDIRSGLERKGPAVLIIDDNDAAAAGIGRLLEFQGCRVSYAYDGNQGLNKARAMSPDLIFLDIGLPDQDGYEVAKKLRAQGYAGKIVALTGYGLNTSQKQQTPENFNQYLVKPVSLAELQKVLSTIH